MRPFAYARPTSVAEAIALLEEHGPDARPLAGGTDLVIRLRDGTLRPSVVVDLKGIRELRPAIGERDGRLSIGAGTTMTDLLEEPLVGRHFPALAEGAAVVGALQIRNQATLAGNVCNASPAADTIPALLVYGAVVVAVGPAGERRVPLDDLLVRSGVTTLRRGELVAAIELPVPRRRIGAVALRRTRRRGHDLASVTVACAVDEAGAARIAYGSVGPRPYLVVDESGVLGDRAAPDEATAEALERVFVDASPSPRSMRAGPDYRLAMLRVLGMEAVRTAIARLHGGAAA
jgi:carbon-monoxide dehydrogenase medium subunit